VDTDTDAGSRTVRVLVVDDDEDDYLITRQLLSDIDGQNYDLAWVSTYDAGLEAIASDQHDVYLLDYRLGERDGLELLREALSSGARGPMILLTGQADHEVDVEGMKAGAMDYLVKGRIDSALLERSIRYAVARQRAEEALRDANENLERRVRERTSRLQAANEHLRQEIVERRRAEEALKQARDQAIEASRVKSEFLANMSHEIRTPMNVIVGVADLLSEAPLPQEQREHVRIFRGAGETLLTLINDILDLSKVEAGQVDLEETDLDIGEIAYDVVEFLAPRAGDKGLELRSHLSPDVPTALVGDPVRLRQVLTNLVSNAIKFTEAGEVVLHVENGPEADGPVCILFRVSDTGIGIPQDKLESIFDSFTQVDSSTTRQYGGTGLGLTISTRLVELMGGRIWVDSIAGEGSTFYFTARFGRQADALERITPRSADDDDSGSAILDNSATDREASPDLGDVPAPQDLRALRILLVEDFADNRMLVQAYLTETPYRLDIAENGEIAVEKYIGGQYDLVLMDMQMPVMDGYAATERIRKWEKEHGVGPTPIIALTANALKEDARRSLDAGCTAHLTKPIKKTPLLKAIYENARRVPA